MPRAAITQLNAYLPDRIVTNSDVESWVNSRVKRIEPTGLERLFGSRERRYAADHEQTSDLAAQAAKPIIENSTTKIDCLIFASACSDLLEPATANIVQQKLQLTCPVFDLKNACNSFVNGVQVASAFLEAGVYKNILITTGEILHQAICFTPPDDEPVSKRLASYTFGDAGAAALLCLSDSEAGIYYQRFKSNGAHWPLSTIPGGGSMHPHTPEKYYFEGFTSELRAQLIAESAGMVDEALATVGWNRADIRHAFTHQVSTPTFDTIAQHAGIPLEKFYNIFSRTGNTAAASIPLAMHMARQEGALKPGDKIMLIGLAAGVSVSIQLMIW